MQEAQSQAPIMEKVRVVAGDHGLSSFTLYAMIRAGVIPSEIIQRIGTTIRINSAAFAALAREGKLSRRFKGRGVPQIVALCLTLILGCGSLHGQAMFFSTNVPHGPAYTGKTCSNTVGSSINTVTCLWSSAPAVGETIHCAVSVFTISSSVVFTVTDNAGTPNTYTANGALVGPATVASVIARLFDSFNISQSPTTLTMTESEINTPFGLILNCFSTSGSVGAAIDGARGTTTVSSATSVGVNISPVAAGDFGFCYTQPAGATTLSPGTAGYAQSALASINYKSGLASGAQTAVTHSSNSVDLLSLCGTYK